MTIRPKFIRDLLPAVSVSGAILFVAQNKEVRDLAIKAGEKVVQKIKAYQYRKKA